MGGNAQRKGFERRNARPGLKEGQDWEMRRAAQRDQLRQGVPPEPARKENVPVRAEAALFEVGFLLDMPTARAVNVAGTFNNWDPNQHPLHKDKGGVWKTRVRVPAGRQEYRFIVDGQWMSDPKAAAAQPNPFGSSNSVLEV